MTKLSMKPEKSEEDYDIEYKAQSLIELEGCRADKSKWEKIVKRAKELVKENKKKTDMSYNAIKRL